MAATDIWLCPQTHGPTDIDLRTATPCGASDVIARSPSGLPPRRRPEPKQLRKASTLRYTVTVTGRGTARTDAHVTATVGTASATKVEAASTVDVNVGSRSTGHVRTANTTSFSVGARHTRTNRRTAAREWRPDDIDELLVLGLFD